MTGLLSITTLLIASAASQTNAFAGNGLLPRTTTLISKSQLSLSSTKTTTLTDETTWRLRLLLNDVTTSQGKKLDGQLFVLEGHFIEEEGYEPPQGLFRPFAKERVEGGTGKDNAMVLEVIRSRWTLSEDPNDKKDGLWIWGLFKEPLYPFMLLQIETKELELPSGTQQAKDGREDIKSDTIPPLKLYAQVTHIRNEEVGVELKTANLNVRVLEKIQLPGASVDLYEEERVGQVSFQPL